MARCRSQPRADKDNLPQTQVLEVPAHKRTKLVGPGGINLRRITSETGARLTAAEGGVGVVVLFDLEILGGLETQRTPRIFDRFFGL